MAGASMAPGWVGAGRHEAEGRPWGADARGQEPGSGQGGRREAAPASGSQELPSCAVMGDATQGDTGLAELSAGHAHTQAASSPTWCRGPAAQLLPPAPRAWLHPQAPLLEPGKALHPPGSTGRRETEKMCWKEALKERDGARSKKRSLFG